MSLIPSVTSLKQLYSLPHVDMDTCMSLQPLRCVLALRSCEIITSNHFFKMRDILHLLASELSIRHFEIQVHTVPFIIHSIQGLLQLPVLFPLRIVGEAIVIHDIR